MLEYHSHFLAMKVDINIFICNIHTLKINMTGGGHLKKIQAAQEGALSAAGGSDDGHYFSFFHLFRHALENLEAAEGLMQILHTN